MPAKWPSASAKNSLKCKCLDVTDLTQRRVRRENPDHFEDCVSNDRTHVADGVRAVLDLVAGGEVLDFGGERVGYERRLAAVENGLSTARYPSEGLFDGGKACRRSRELTAAF